MFIGAAVSAGLTAYSQYRSNEVLTQVEGAHDFWANLTSALLSGIEVTLMSLHGSVGGLKTVKNDIKNSNFEMELKQYWE